MKRITVILPVFNQSSFVRCAIMSVLRQSCADWELLVIDDGSAEDIKSVIADYLKDSRITYYRNAQNEGLGYTLNRGISLAKGQYIAYLPADDIYFEDHLGSLLQTIETENADFAYSGIVHSMGNGGEGRHQTAKGRISGLPLQLVQVMHRKTQDRWVERSELVTDDLDAMFWTKFLNNNPRQACTGEVSCEWFAHMYQRHRIINDRMGGGIYMYKTYYGVKEPIRFKSREGSLEDEITAYADFRNTEIPTTDGNEKPLKILIVGELAYNAERITALEARGHKLYGLWINNPLNYNTVGPLPFGHVEDIPFEGWEKRVAEIKPDIIYALLNFGAVNLAYHVLTHCDGIPFVWHFKEGPFFCRTHGLWDKLIYLTEHSNGVIYTNSTLREWYNLFIREECRHTMVLDGDLPSQHWFTSKRKPLLSATDGAHHTVIAGRLLGITSEDIEAMAQQNIHIHIYGDVFQRQSQAVIDEASALVPGYVHLHPNCPARNWVEEFSQYDAGWLHYYQSHNHGDLLRANWIDLNSPARMSTYAVAGLPMIMHNNAGHIVHHQRYLQSLGMAVAINDFGELGDALSEPDNMQKLHENTWKNREAFCFDNYADRLINFFREVAEDARQ